MKITAGIGNALLLMSLAPQPAYCGDATGTITELIMLIDVPDRLLIRVSGANGSPAPCTGQSNPYYVFDTSTNMGKQIYAALLAAKHANAAITLHGFGTCNLRSNTEDLRGITQT